MQILNRRSPTVLQYDYRIHSCECQSKSFVLWKAFGVEESCTQESRKRTYFKNIVLAMLLKSSTFISNCQVSWVHPLVLGLCLSRTVFHCMFLNSKFMRWFCVCGFIWTQNLIKTIKRKMYIHYIRNARDCSTSLYSSKTFTWIHEPWF